MTGAPIGTFVYFRALKSLKQWDDDEAGRPGVNKAMTEAYGGEEAARKIRLEGAELVTVSDNAVYSMSPKISRPAPEFAKHDVAFWAPKPTDTRTAAAAAKPGTTKQPASIKKEGAEAVASRPRGEGDPGPPDRLRPRGMIGPPFTHGGPWLYPP